MAPPVRKRAWRSMNVFPRSEAAASKLPGHPPRWSANAIAGRPRRTTGVPVRFALTSAWPTRTPRLPGEGRRVAVGARAGVVVADHPLPDRGGPPPPPAVDVARAEARGQGRPA